MVAVGRPSSWIHVHKHSNVSVKPDGTITSNFSTRDREINLQKWDAAKQQSPVPVILPTKEVIFMFHGLAPALAKAYIELEELYGDGTARST